jgi:hypothetical protein
MSLDVNFSITGKTATLHMSMDLPVLLPLFNKLLAATAQILFTLRGWMDGWNYVAVVAASEE